MRGYINLNHGFVNGKWTSSNIRESTDIINEYLIERDNADFMYLDFNKALIRYLIIVYK